jgi:hypothetical protein
MMPQGQTPPEQLVYWIIAAVGFAVCIYVGWRKMKR